MSESPLPENQQDREIFLVALRDFSDRCRAPELTAECPFSVDIEDGLRGCGEECQDLLSRYVRLPTRGEVQLPGTEMRAHPRTKRAAVPRSWPGRLKCRLNGKKLIRSCAYGLSCGINWPIR